MIQRRHLLLSLTRRELRDRYAGSWFGFLWALIQPVLSIAILIAVFGFAFSAKLGDAVGVHTDYAAHVVAGFLPWMALSGGMLSAVGCVRANAGLVKQIDFPQEVLPTKTMLSQVVGQLIGLGFLIIYITLRHGTPSATLFLVIPALLLEIMLAVGLGFILATLGAYFRDLEHVLPSILSINLYLLPIFFPKGAIPKVIQPLVEWNPFTPLVQLFQDIIVNGDVGSVKGWVVTAGMALASMEFGYRLFRRARGGFGDIV